MSAHRDTVRAARRDLRRLGCTCHPTITLQPPEIVQAVGARFGAFVRHQARCPLGDRMLDHNRRGVTPAVITEGCRR